MIKFNNSIDEFASYDNKLHNNPEHRLLYTTHFIREENVKLSCEARKLLERGWDVEVMGRFVQNQELPGFDNVFPNTYTDHSDLEDKLRKFISIVEADKIRMALCDSREQGSSIQLDVYGDGVVRITTDASVFYCNIPTYRVGDKRYNLYLHELTITKIGKKFVEFRAIGSGYVYKMYRDKPHLLSDPFDSNLNPLFLRVFTDEKTCYDWLEEEGIEIVDYMTPCVRCDDVVVDNEIFYVSKEGMTPIALCKECIRYAEAFIKNKENK